MAKKTFSFSLSKIRLFTAFLIHWQLCLLLLFSYFFTTKLYPDTGKYHAISNEALPVFANKKDAPSFSKASSLTAQKIHLYVNLDTCRLYVYIDNKLQEYLFVSGGRANAQTPLGTFSLTISEHAFSFSAPNRNYLICSTNNSSFAGTPTGLKNFSDGDLYLSPYDYAKLTEILSTSLHSPTITIYCSSYPWQTLELGMCNQDVLKIQQILYSEKHYSGPLNGYFCEQTKQAVVNFQKKHGLFATGAVNAATYSSMFNNKNFNSLHY